MLVNESLVWIPDTVLCGTVEFYVSVATFMLSIPEVTLQSLKIKFALTVAKSVNNMFAC